MIPIAEFQNRSNTGPVMTDAQFDIELSSKLRQIVANHNIKYNPEELIVDDRTADEVFKAGVELLSQVGMYHKNTSRLIRFDRKEVEQIARETIESPQMETLGKDQDRVVVRKRTSEDPSHIVVIMHTSKVVPEEIILPCLQSFAQEELAQGSGGLNLMSYGGVPNKIGTLAEIICALGVVKYRLEAVRRAGKPGMHLGRAPGISMAAQLVGFINGRLGRNSELAVRTITDLQISWEELIRTACAEELGIVRSCGGYSVMGALARGPEEAAVLQIADGLATQGFGHGTVWSIGCVSIDGSRSTREVIWGRSASARAAERNLGVPIGTTIGSMAGGCTEMAFYEHAAQIVALVCSGIACNLAQEVRTKGGLSSGGLQSRLVAETAHAVAGMKRPKANELVLKILTKYEAQLSEPPRGKDFPDTYDLKTITPTAEFLKVYTKAKNGLARLGVNFR